MFFAKQKLEKQKLSKETIKNLPETAGIYVFWNESGRPLYIGKANNLKRRIDSYLTTNLSTKTSKMITETEKFSFIRVNSELEALLLEARLIKKNQPKYNFTLRDDKHPLYIKITKEMYPRVITARKIEENSPSGGQTLAFFGPFPSSRNVRAVLRMIRKIFPYSDHKLSKRGCLYSQIGLCYPCPSEIEKLKSENKKEELREIYLDNIRLIKGVFNGRIKFVRRGLTKKMKHFAEEEKFEQAAKVRSQIEKLDYITQPVIPIARFLKNPNLIEDIRDEELKELTKILSGHMDIISGLTRIECYDVAHLSGESPTASMVTFIKGEPDKSLYRHFRISLPAGKAGQKKGQDDIASLKEVAKRRVKYFSSWGTPDLIIVDGGKNQVSALLEVLSTYRIPIVGLAKRKETLVIPKKVRGANLYHPSGGFILTPLTSGPARNLVQRIRDEAHRFARRYHHKLIKKGLIPGK